MDDRILLSGPADCLFLVINFSLRIALLSVSGNRLAAETGTIGNFIWPEDYYHYLQHKFRNLSKLSLILELSRLTIKQNCLPEMPPH